MDPYQYGSYAHVGWTVGHGVWLALAIAIGLYFLPTLIARGRDVVSGGAIFLVNLLFGWTMIGWIGCLLWAMLGETRAHLAWRTYAAYGPPPRHWR
ncbi:MAG TPA: superinfection immunity protein [Acetobacteraceae bacterium]|nr:superinfection immunity protein [Acetobacteraceae bacterium]